jgi:hypothetical protein
MYYSGVQTCHLLYRQGAGTAHSNTQPTLFVSSDKPASPSCTIPMLERSYTSSSDLGTMSVSSECPRIVEVRKPTFGLRLTPQHKEQISP